MTILLRVDEGAVGEAVDARLAAWAEDDLPARLWRKDPSIWARGPVAELTDRLGWLDLPTRLPAEITNLEAFGSVVRSEFSDVVVLGMGGSSLAPEVYQEILGSAPGYPRLHVLDSTHPIAILTLESRIDVSKTLFIVSSKSGTTLETLSFFRYFWDRASDAGRSPGNGFAAVTDPGSPLERLANRRGFRWVFRAPPDVGGRYSALTEFGMVPAAAIGADLAAVQAEAADAASRCGPDVQPRANPGLVLGAFLGEAARAGRDKATLVTSRSLRPLVAWIEQLVAESTGKDGRGIVPIGGDEDAGLGPDRCVVSIDTDDDAFEPAVADGEPVARMRLGSVRDLGGAMFVLEMAVAAAGSILDIHPFNQPDVQLAKDLARRSMSGELDTSGIAELHALDPDLSTAIRRWLYGVAPPEYVGIQAYLPPSDAVRAALEAARVAVRDARGVSTTYDFGPRFLHSTGQLHKGGPRVGRFLQIVDDPTPDVDVPGTDYSFGRLIRAQALGDYKALEDRGQRVLRISLGDSGVRGLEAVLAAVVSAAA